MLQRPADWSTPQLNQDVSFRNFLVLRIHRPYICVGVHSIPGSKERMRLRAASQMKKQTLLVNGQVRR